MSPILTRPVREQLEHDRVIRLLQARYRRKFEVAINPGPEQNASVTIGELAMYPDVLLYAQAGGRRLLGTIEVETGESVTTLEAMAEWGPFSRLRAPFYLYVPPNAVDTARRLCVEHQIAVAELWTYHTAIDQVRFTMVYRAPEAGLPKPRPAPKTERGEKPRARERRATPASARPVRAARKAAAAKKPAGRAPRSGKAAPKAAARASKAAKRR